MCDDRERLIGYVYDESDAAERRRIEEHLAGCADCRWEIASLRAVRQDLLAWDVPSHASVWRPVAPVRTISWRDVPTWAMAAAAALVLMAGAAGGAAAQVLLSRPAAEVAETSTTAPMGGQLARTNGAPTVADVESLERRLAVIRAELRAEMEDRVRRVSAGSPVVQERRAGAREVPEEFRQLVTVLYNDFVGMKKEVSGIEDKVDSVMALAQPQAVPVSLQGQ
jgi:hypothetical protein